MAFDTGMDMTVSSTQPAEAMASHLPGLTAGWFLKRAIIGLIVLTMAVACFAWLTYTSLQAADAERGPEAGIAQGR